MALLISYFGVGLKIQQERRLALLRGFGFYYSAATVATSAPITDWRSAQTWRILAASA